MHTWVDSYRLLAPGTTGYGRLPPFSKSLLGISPLVLVRPGLTYWCTLVIGQQEKPMILAARGIIHLNEQPLFSMKHAESPPMPNALDKGYTN